MMTYLFTAFIIGLLSINLCIDWCWEDNRLKSIERTMFNLIASVIGLLGIMFLDWGPYLALIPMASGFFLIFAIFGYRKVET